MPSMSLGVLRARFHPCKEPGYDFLSRMRVVIKSRFPPVVVVVLTSKGMVGNWRFIWGLKLNLAWNPSARSGW